LPSLVATILSPSASTSQARSRGRGVVFVTYNGLLDPLGPSQMLAYLERLNRQWPIHILSFERPDKLGDATAVATMERRLADQQIRWTRLRYHKFPSLPATMWDVLQGILALRRIVRQESPGLIHCRHYLPMTIALRGSGGVPLLFDIRGLQPDEYVDGGLWREGELKWRLAKRSERASFKAAAGAVVLTENIRPYVESYFARLRGKAPPLRVIPCCVDLARFTFDHQARARNRQALQVGDDVLVFCYTGSIGTWYLPDEMARFVRTFRDRSGRRVCLLWLVNNGQDVAAAASRAAGLADQEFRLLNVRSADVPGWLSCADVALALIRPSFSKRSSSPTKYAECLAIGLPLLISRDVGDGALVAKEAGAVALSAFDAAALAAAADEMAALLQKPRAHFRAVAQKLFDVDAVALPAYRELYQELVRP
jgi:glycosyltransferase involved in cell wall biosynthesis